MQLYKSLVVTVYLHFFKHSKPLSTTFCSINIHNSKLVELLNNLVKQLFQVVNRTKFNNDILLNCLTARRCDIFILLPRAQGLSQAQENQNISGGFHRLSPCE